MLLPPGRRVYQKGSYTLWEIDGAQQPVRLSSVNLMFYIDAAAVLPESESFRETLHRPQSEHHDLCHEIAKADEFSRSSSMFVSPTELWMMADELGGKLPVLRSL